ncbi:MAG: hypothetical protein ACP5P3_09470 [Ignavibacteria bacterium]
MPSAAHLHLLINHLPVFGTAFLLLMLLYAIGKRNQSALKLNFALVVLLGLLTIPVFISGENAEGGVKGIEGVNEEAIEPHEEFAKSSLIVMEITAGLALIGVLIGIIRKSIPLWFAVFVLLLLLATQGMMIYTSHLGGKISHFEIMKN